MPYEPDDYLSRHFQTGSIDLTQQVAELARNASPPNSPNAALYQEMFMSVARMAQADRNRWDAKIMLQTLRLDSAGRITAVVPYLCYARSDKKDNPRVCRCRTYLLA